MERGHEEASTSQAGLKWETLTESSLVVAMSVEDLRSFRQVPATIIFEMSDGTATSTMGTTDNAVYFTGEQFDARLCLHVPSLVKQFLHFTRAPPRTRTSECLSDSYGLQCAKLSLQVGYFAGRDLFYLHFEAWD